MGFDLSVFLFAGMQDALSPLSWAVAGIVALMMILLRQHGRARLLIAAGVFITLVVLGLLSRLMIFDVLFAVPGLVTAAPWVLLAAGILFAAAGVLFLREWRMLIAGVPRQFAAFMPAPRMGAGGLVLCFLAAGFAAGVLSCLWPVSYQVLVQGEMTFMPGRLVYSLAALCVYEFLRNGAVLAVVLFFMLARRPAHAAFLHSRGSLVSIIASAFCLAVGGSLVFFFHVAATKPWL